MNTKQQDRINAGIALGVHRFSALRCAALKLALAYFQPKHPDRVKILRICDRFRVGDAFAFYSTHQELYWKNEA